MGKTPYRAAVLLAIATMGIHVPAAAAGFYIEGGLSALHQPHRFADETILIAAPIGQWDDTTHYAAIPTSFRPLRQYDISVVRNPYGSLAFGYDWSWPRWTVDFRLSHDSSIPVNDRGRESFSLNVRWYPFGGH